MALLEAPGAQAPDLRLALPAGAAWVTAWQGRLLPVWVLASGAVLLALTAVGVLLRSRSGRAAVLAATLACAAAAGLATAARVHARTTGPLADAASRTAAVRAEVVLTEDPRAVASGKNVLTFRRLVVVRARIERLEVAGQGVRLRAPVLVLTSDERWLHLLPSQRVRVEGRVQRADGALRPLARPTAGRPAQAGAARCCGAAPLGRERVAARARRG
jgi:competence protein ComEC